MKHNLEADMVIILRRENTPPNSTPKVKQWSFPSSPLSRYPQNLCKKCSHKKETSISNPLPLVPMDRLTNKNFYSKGVIFTYTEIF